MPEVHKPNWCLYHLLHSAAVADRTPQACLLAYPFSVCIHTTSSFFFSPILLSPQTTLCLKLGLAERRDSTVGRDDRPLPLLYGITHALKRNKETGGWPQEYERGEEDDGGGKACLCSSRHVQMPRLKFTISSRAPKLARARKCIGVASVPNRV